MNKNKIIWEPEAEAKLVELVKQKEYIWNTKHERFLNLRNRKETFTEIAQILGSNFTMNSVKERWRNIRNTYRFNLRRIKVSKNSGKSENIYEPSWHLWSSLQFLSSIEKTDDVSGDITEDTVKEESRALTDRLAQNEIVKQIDGTQSKVLKSVLDSSLSQVNTNENYTLNKTNKSQCEILLEEAKAILKSLENDPRLDLKINIRYANFGKTVASSLSEMSPTDAEDAIKKITHILSSYS